MNKITSLFERKREDILNIYFTAGYPKLDDTAKVLSALEQHGADLVEIGMPYSDPLADGLTIQKSSEQALANGMKMNLLFEQLEEANKTVNIPRILMGYFNQVMQFGVEQFLARAKSVGVDALILPDMPLYEYEEVYQDLFKKYDMGIAFLVTPQTSEERIRKIDELSTAFVYVVSSASTTGKQQGFSDENKAYFKRIKNMNLKNPTLIGFGISTHKDFKMASSFTNGAIIGSAFIRALAKAESIDATVKEFVNNIKSPTYSTLH